jgi:hypothetical protein
VASIPPTPVIVNRLKLSNQSALTDVAGASALASPAGTADSGSNRQLSLSLATGSAAPGQPTVQPSPSVNSAAAAGNSGMASVSAIAAAPSATLGSPASDVTNSVTDDGFILNLGVLDAVVAAGPSSNRKG